MDFKFIIVNSCKSLYTEFFFHRKSSSCTHVSALVHALMAMSPTQFPQPSASAEEEAEDPLPVTSYLCQWKQPKKRKESTLKVSEANIEKHVYGRVRKIK